MYYVEDKSIKYEKISVIKQCYFALHTVFSAKEQNILSYILCPTVKWKWNQTANF